ncbi:MAG: tetratricopeptide repeat protein [Armatimonadetes bacterium]|nr:tetratricopeptide repeat protein [Armatimonadota bacterium]NDK17328.1 tetratricopeptide repeat protein [Armatimonadota bacterium]
MTPHRLTVRILSVNRPRSEALVSHACTVAVASVVEPLRLPWSRERDPETASADELRKCGARELARNRPLQAIPPLEAAFAKEAGSFATRINLATAYYLTAQHAKAVPHLRYVLAIEDQNPTALLNLAACLDALGQLDESIQCLEKLLRGRPSWKDGHYNLAIAYLKRDDKAAAEVALKRELELNPQHRAARDLLNRVYITTAKSPGEDEKDPPTDD